MYVAGKKNQHEKTLYIWLQKNQHERPRMKHLLFRHALLVLSILMSVGAIISFTGGAKHHGHEKIRFTTQWPPIFVRGKPESTPILYCGNTKHRLGLYVKTPEGVRFDEHSELYFRELCHTFAAAGTMTSLHFNILSVVVVALFAWRSKSTQGMARLCMCVASLVARVAYYWATDEPHGAEFDKSDHVLIVVVLMWLFAWFSMTVVEEQISVGTFLSKTKIAVSVAAAIGVYEMLLQSLYFTARFFHTSLELWSALHDSLCFVALLSVSAVFIDNSQLLIHTDRWKAIARQAAAAAKRID